MIVERIARSYPSLKRKLKQARLTYTPEIFIKNTLKASLIFSLGLFIFLFLVTAKFKMARIAVLTFPLVYFFIFMYMMRYPDLAILKKNKEASREIIFVGRFLIIELQSGVSLYQAFKGISKNYKILGPFFGEIVTKVDMGISMEDAINQSIELSPSKDFTRILWQILNSIKTGSDVATSIESMVDLIAKEHLILLQEYSRKLNPLAMFYMIVAIILPTLGITMGIIFSSFLSLELNIYHLLSIAGFLGFVQFMFLSIIKSSRPAVDSE